MDNKNKQPSSRNITLCGNMGNKIVQPSNLRDLYQEGKLTEYTVQATPDPNEPIMPYEKFMKNKYGM